MTPAARPPVTDDASAETTTATTEDALLKGGTNE